jgi:hypothetical protein
VFAIANALLLFRPARGAELAVFKIIGTSATSMHAGILTESATLRAKSSIIVNHIIAPSANAHLLLLSLLCFALFSTSGIVCFSVAIKAMDLLLKSFNLTEIVALADNALSGLLHSSKQ